MFVALISRASSTSSSSAAAVGAFATLLHAPDSPAFSSAFALSSASLQTPDSSPDTALLLAPALSCDVAGPPFDSRVSEQFRNGLL
jgi:hypothetical protein